MGATSTRSSSAASARLKPSLRLTTPRFSPFSSISRICVARICLLIRYSSLLLIAFSLLRIRSLLINTNRVPETGTILILPYSRLNRQPEFDRIMRTGAGPRFPIYWFFGAACEVAPGLTTRLEIYPSTFSATSFRANALNSATGIEPSRSPLRRRISTAPSSISRSPTTSM